MKNILKDLSLSKKISSIVIFIIAMFSIVLIGLVLEINGLYGNMKEYNDEKVKLLEEEVNLYRAVNDIYNINGEIIITALNDISKVQPLTKELDKEIAEVQQNISDVYSQAVLLYGNDNEYVKSIEIIEGEISELIDISLAIKEAVLKEDIDKLATTAQTNIFDSATDDILGIMLTLKNQTYSANDFFNISIFTIIFIIISISLFITWRLNKWLKYRLNNVVENVENLANGQFNLITATNSLDEIGQIERKISETSEIIEEAIEEIKNATYQNVELGITLPTVNYDKFNGEYKELARRIDGIFIETSENIKVLIEALVQVSKGDFSIQLEEFKGDKKVVSDVYKVIVDNLNLIGDEITNLAECAIDGDLSVVIDETKYNGAWRDVIFKLNTLVTAVAEPFTELNGALSSLKEGDLSISINGEYNGIYNNTKEDFNATISLLKFYISEISDVLYKIANDKRLDVSLDDDFEGDFAEIKLAINSIIDILNNRFKTIYSISSDVKESSEELTQSNIKIATGATEQLSTITQLNEYLNDINNGVQDITTNTEKASEKAKDAKEYAVEGDSKMKEMLQAMTEIKVASDNISNIIKVIDDIAFQTNLLALNASVEAARAGQHGKGFAVVAEEVRTLASRSKEAAKETSILINESLDKVELGNNLAVETADSLIEIVDNASEVSMLLNDISTYFTVQTKAIDEITSNLQMFKETVEINTNVSERGAEISKELLETSENLSKVISSITFKED